MLAQIEEFGQLLRKNGLRVSTAEIMDAAAATAAVGVRDPVRVRAALAATLVKNAADRPTFDELFDLYFRRDAVLDELAADAPLAAMVRAALAREAGTHTGELERKLTEVLAQAAMAASPMARMAMGMREPHVAAMLRAADMAIDLGSIRSPLQAGFYAYRLGEALGIGRAESEALDMAARAAGGLGLGQETGEALKAELAKGFARLRQALRAYVQQAFARQNIDYMRELAIETLAEKPLAQLSESEVAELRREVMRLARLLRARLAQRPEVQKRGRLDLGRTLRRSLATGGVPFALHIRRRRRHKPRLVVLCDVSDSVRNVSRFMLQLVYTLQELFDKVQSFAFVAELGELTDLFRQYDLERAIELTYAGTVVSTFANSNYGRTLEQFTARHLDKVTARTTVMIIGDGRNNYHPSRASLLGDVRRRARQVLWLNPESPAVWGFGDSAMREYEPHCDRVMVVRNLEGLRKVIDHLVL